MNDILIRKGLGRALGVCLTLLVSSAVHARTVYMLDFDGTITDDQSELSAWRTPWILRRIDQLRNLLQPNPQLLKLPETVEVSYREYRRLASRLGRGDGQINALAAETLDVDPLDPARTLSITPGYYAVDEHISFKYYRPPVGRTKSYLVRDLKDAILRTELLNANRRDELGRELTPDETYRWQGPAFALVQKALSRPDTVRDLIISTARDHGANELEGFLRTLKNQGLVKHIYRKADDGRKLPPRFYSMSEPEALQFGRVGLGVRKSGVLQALAEELLHSTEARHRELSADEVAAERGDEVDTHTLIVGEDDPRYLNQLRERMESLSGDLGYTHRIKFVLLNAGSDQDVAKAYWPWRWTVIHKGHGRSATAAEIAKWTGSGCETALR